MKSRIAAMLVLSLAAAGCAADREAYPSLAPRAAEAHGFAEPPVPVAMPVANDPALDAQIAAIERPRAAAAEAFAAGAARAERAAVAAKGARAGSDTWLDAQTALAECDSLRARHQGAVGTLEDLAAARAQALQPAYPALEAALTAARAAATEQTQRIDAIAARLAPA